LLSYSGREEKGKIVSDLFGLGSGSKGYDVMLLKSVPVTHALPPRTIKYKDWHNKEQGKGDYTNDNGIIVRLQVVFIHSYLIIKKIPEAIYLKCISIPENIIFRNALKRLWSNLIFRHVDIVKLSFDNILSITRSSIDENGKYNEECATSTSDKQLSSHEISLIGKSISVTYSYYFGFTKRECLSDNDPYDGLPIFFAKTSYNTLDFTILKNCQFGKCLNFRGGHTPPQGNQYVCGIVKRNSKGLHFTNWFIASPEFFSFWKLIMSDSWERLSPAVISYLSKSHYWDYRYDDNLTVKEKQERMIIPNHESDSYDRMAKFIFNGEEFDQEFIDHVILC